MDIKIIKPNGDNFTFEQHGITVNDFHITSIELRSNYEDKDGANGRVDHGSTYGVRTIAIPFTAKSRDLLDFPLMRDLIFKLVSDTKPFYIQESRRAEMFNYAFTDFGEPAKIKSGTENSLINGKRYLVRLSETFNLEQTLLRGEGELVFETVELPFAESVGTTQDPFTFDSEMWQIGQGLPLEDTIYLHSTNSFQIYNAGDVVIDPREMPLKINFTGVSSNLTIKNLTTGDSWQYNSTTAINDEITIEGIRSLKNGAGVFKNTNKKLITIAPGWNDFEITGASDFTISFDFRFYYI